MTETAVKLCWELDDRARNVRCHDWEGCYGREYYQMKDIQYCRYQVLYLLNLIDFVGDKYETVSSWPDDPRIKETGYSDVNVQTSPSNHANYEALEVITAELIFRLERTGKDGRLLLFEARTRDRVEELSRDARNALNYVAGDARKHRSYRQWLADRDYKKKEKK